MSTAIAPRTYTRKTSSRCRIAYQLVDGELRRKMGFESSIIVGQFGCWPIIASQTPSEVAPAARRVSMLLRFAQ